MGKPPSLGPRRGLRGGCDFSLAQTKAEPWHLSPDSCVSQLLNSQTQGRCQFGEGGEHGCVHSHPNTPSHSHPPPHTCNASCCPFHPNKPTLCPRDPALWERTPIPRGLTALPPCTCPAEPAASALGPLPSQGGAQRRGCLVGGGTLCLMGYLSLKVL